MRNFILWEKTSRTKNLPFITFLLMKCWRISLQSHSHEFFWSDIVNHSDWFKFADSQQGGVLMSLDMYFSFCSSVFFLSQSVTCIVTMSGARLVEGSFFSSFHNPFTSLIAPCAAAPDLCSHWQVMSPDRTSYVQQQSSHVKEKASLATTTIPSHWLYNLFEGSHSKWPTQNFNLKFRICFRLLDRRRLLIWLLSNLPA